MTTMTTRTTMSMSTIYSPRRVVAEVSPLLPAASVSSFVSRVVPVAEHLVTIMIVIIPVVIIIIMISSQHNHQAMTLGRDDKD